jgi:internalin A
MTHKIHALEMRRTPFAKSWFEVKEALDTMGEDYISYDRYYALCREKEVTDETAQNVLLQFLHDLGIVLAFRNLELHDTQVINPLWLTNAVYPLAQGYTSAGAGLRPVPDFTGTLSRTSIKSTGK